MLRVSWVCLLRWIVDGPVGVGGEAYLKVSSHPTLSATFLIENINQMDLKVGIGLEVGTGTHKSIPVCLLDWTATNLQGGVGNSPGTTVC